MKRLIAILLAVMLMSFVLTACSGTANYDNGLGYGNVSTTPNGRVNGGEGYYGQNGGVFDSNKRSDGMFGDMFGNDNSGRGNYGSSYNSGSGSYNGSTGSGMTGGR